MTLKRMMFVVLMSAMLLLKNSNSLKLPAEIVTCSKSDANIEECLKVAIETVLNLFKEGNGDFNFPNILPLSIPKLTIGEGSGAVNVVQNYENVEIHGLLPTNILSAQFVATDDGIYYKFESVNPKAWLTADYNMNGRVLLLPAHGQGKCNITLDNLHIVHNIEGKFIDQNGGKYLEITKYTVKTKPDHAYYNFDNLFDGDQVLGSEMNKLLNDNWKEIYEDVSKGYDEVLGLIFKELSSKIFSKVPIDDLMKP